MIVVLACLDRWRLDFNDAMRRNVLGTPTTPASGPQQAPLPLGAPAGALPVTGSAGSWHRIGLVPRSLKNRRRLIVAGGRPMLVPSADAARDTETIREQSGITRVELIRRPADVRI